jgi:hypothetical protein
MGGFEIIKPLWPGGMDYCPCSKFEYRVSRVEVRELSCERLDLFSAPSSIRLSHILRRFNARHEFQHHVRNTYYTDHGAKDLIQEMFI